MPTNSSATQVRSATSAPVTGDMVEQNKRGSAAAVESGHSAGKKARANGEVKQEQQEEEEEKEEGEVSQEESGRTGPLVAVAAMEETQIDVRIAVGLLHCQACLLPLKPPVFKCEAAHVVCSGCRGGHGQLCRRAAIYTHCGELDAIVGTARVPCGYSRYGCDSYVVYAAVTDHQRVCPCAPCSCPEPGCDTYNSPATLLVHFATDHSWPVTEISYGKPCRLTVPPPRLCHVLVGEGDRALFLVSSCAVGAGTAICVVCVTANGDSAAAQYKCKLWVEVSTNNDNMAMITSKVRGNDLSGGFPAADKGMLLWVPPDLAHEVSGDGETPILSIRIDRAGAAAAAAKSATSRTRSQRRMQ